jgi:hypothetical protein
MNRKTTLSTAIGLVLGSSALGANASLTSSATLNFTLGSIGCELGTIPPCTAVTSYPITDIVGSYFAMDLDKNGIDKDEKIPFGSLNGIHLGSTQAADGSHGGPIDGTETPNIDNPWTFFGATGMNQTTSPITDLTGTGSTRTLDFSGWNIAWNGIDSIPLADLGTTITCDTASCSDSSNYTIDGAFHVLSAGFTQVFYALHLEGHITSTVPIPAAAWLFGSGLAGLMSIVRRRKAL